jgi:hypothetical protein
MLGALPEIFQTSFRSSQTFHRASPEFPQDFPRKFHRVSLDLPEYFPRRNNQQQGISPEEVTNSKAFSHQAE